MIDFSLAAFRISHLMVISTVPPAGVNFIFAQEKIIVSNNLRP